jgi:aldehyde dehydrogenase (NAD+)
MDTIIAETDVKARINAIFQHTKKIGVVLRSEPVEKRIERLQSLRKWIHQNRPAIHQAAYADFSKPAVEVDGTEIFHVLNEIKHASANLHDWTAPKKIDAPLTMLGTRSWIEYEPKGTCLIISPWNYPFSLAVGPLVSALAAGNAVILKPSELTPHVSALIRRMAADVFRDGSVSVIEGDATTAQTLLSLPFDHIFFTGSPAVGKLVMKAAAEHLTSVTLELGGKSPTIVTGSANLKDAAKRIIVSKFVNNGQTCIAPDYILVDKKVAQKLTAELISNLKYHFGADGKFDSSASYCRIVNNKHFNRLDDLLRDSIEGGAKIEFGGSVDSESRFFHPVILSAVAPSSRILQEEIFGPILPLVEYNDLDEAINFINGKPKPLALYIYTSKKSESKKVRQQTSSGAVAINDSAIHFLHHNLPFGGVNNSGIGKSHGYHGFLAFTNEKPVLKQKSGLTSIQVFYPPYSRLSKRIMDWFLKFF